jgi:hypothetical protein
VCMAIVPIFWRRLMPCGDHGPSGHLFGDALLAPAAGNAGADLSV